MSSRLEISSSISIFSLAGLIVFGSSGVGSLFWSVSISAFIEERSFSNRFLRSCFCLARTLSLWSFFRVWRRSAWFSRMFDLFFR